MSPFLCILIAKWHQTHTRKSINKDHQIYLYRQVSDILVAASSIRCLHNVDVYIETFIKYRMWTWIPQVYSFIPSKQKLLQNLLLTIAHQQLLHSLLKSFETEAIYTYIFGHYNPLVRSSFSNFALCVSFCQKSGCRRANIFSLTSDLAYAAMLYI